MTVLAWGILAVVGLPTIAFLLWAIFTLMSEDWVFVGIIAVTCVIAIALTWASHQVNMW